VLDWLAQWVAETITPEPRRAWVWALCVLLLIAVAVVLAVFPP
jgi:hypothetical protein